ncbi:MAG: PH domain-containing protein [Chloroflexi bacterium]|nr:PH domain-containing protein [Chloroflexota bacterium]
MSYADRLMSAGERIVLRDRQHWFVLVWSARYAVLALLGSLLLFILYLNQPVEVQSGTPGRLLGILAAVGFIGGLAYLVWQWLRYVNQEYILTNRRVMQSEGVINKRVTDSSLEKINDAVLTQSFVGRIFGFGDLDVLTASESGIERFRMILDPIAFKRAMLEAKHEYEMDMNRMPTPVGPPLRAAPEERPNVWQVAPTPPVMPPSSTPPPSAPWPPPPVREPVPDATDHLAVPAASDRPADPSSDVRDAGSGPAEWTAADGLTEDVPASRPAASAPPAAPSEASRMSPDDVTRTLASLADLRDRGAISAEDYDTKKQELLGRL